MKIELPFRYNAEVRLKRHRTPRRVTLISNVEMEVPAVTSADAPVALRLRQTSPSKKADKTIELRWFQDRLYRRAPDINAFLSPTGFLADAQWDPDRHGYDPSDVADVVSNQRQETVAEIKKITSDMIAIDGETWYPTNEPTINIENRTGLGEPEVFHLFVDSDSSLMGQSFGCYRADELDVAVEDLKRLRPGATVTIDSNYDVLIPEALSQPIGHRLLSEASWAFLREMDHDLFEKPEEYLIAFARLREATKLFSSLIDTWKRGEDAPSPRRLMDALNVAAACPEIAKDHFTARVLRAMKNVESLNSRDANEMAP